MDIITLFEELMNSIFDAEEKFIENPKEFYSLEKSVKTSTENFAAKYLGAVLSGVNKYVKVVGEMVVMLLSEMTNEQ